MKILIVNEKENEKSDKWQTQQIDRYQKNDEELNSIPNDNNLIFSMGLHFLRFKSSQYLLKEE